MTLGDGLAAATELTFSPDSEVLARAQGSAVTLWDLAEGTEKAVLHADAGRSVTRLAFTPGGDRLAAVVDGAKIVVWGPQPESVNKFYPRQNHRVTQIAFSADGRFPMHQTPIGHPIRAEVPNSRAATGTSTGVLPIPSRSQSR